MESDDRPMNEVESVLHEARTLMEMQYGIARRMLRVTTVFRIIGYVTALGLLVSPFGFTGPVWLAPTFGVLLLTVTVLDQHFRPDVKFINAKGRFLQLKRAVTTGEESLKRLQTEGPDIRAGDTIVKHLSGVIDEVERALHLDFAMIRRPLVSVLPADPTPSLPRTAD